MACRRVGVFVLYVGVPGGSGEEEAGWRLREDEHLARAFCEEGAATLKLLLKQQLIDNYHLARRRLPAAANRTAGFAGGEMLFWRGMTCLRLLAP